MSLKIKLIQNVGYNLGKYFMTDFFPWNTHTETIYYAWLLYG